MTEAQLGTGPDKARFVSQMFSRIARHYDLMNGLMTFGMHHSWRRVAARQTIPSPEGPALDLATGTGDLALELRELHPHRNIVGADFSEGMLAVARDKVRAAGDAGRIRLVAADALALPFDDRAFACVTSAFLLRNLADLRHGLAEMKRVTWPDKSQVRQLSVGVVLLSLFIGGVIALMDVVLQQLLVRLPSAF